MSLAALIRSMAEAGAPPEAIALAVEAIEARDAVLDAKRAGDRERKRRQRAGTVTGQSRDIPETVTPVSTAPLSPSPSPPDPPNPAPIPVKNIYTRETPKPPPKAYRLKTDWTPTETDLAFAAKQGLSSEEASREADKFRDYWCARSGRDATKLDWPGTWRNWVRTSVDRRRGPATPRQPPNGNRPEARSMAEIITRRRREEADGEPIPR